jgi:hypothetical protein
MKYKYLAVLGLILLLTGCQGSGELENNMESGTFPASEKRGALVLYKEPLFEIGGAPREAGCQGLYKVVAGKDVPDMRDFPYFVCDGRYTLTFSGNKGATISLFGKLNYRKEAGFMVIVKNDNRKLWVINLNDIPSGKWTTVKAGRQSGGYEVFYRKASRFDQNISSVKWGQWWQGDTQE